MTEDGGIDHNDDKTLFDALAIRLYNGGFFLAYKYDRDDPDNQYGYWEYRKYWDKNGNGQPDEGEQYYVREVCIEYVNYFGGVGN